VRSIIVGDHGAELDKRDSLRDEEERKKSRRGDWGRGIIKRNRAEEESQGSEERVRTSRKNV